MFGIDTESGAMPRVGHLDYSYVVKQASRRALCHFCNKWHSFDTTPPGAPLAGECKGRYVRQRQVAIIVRALDGGSLRFPSNPECALAIKDAWRRRK